MSKEENNHVENEPQLPDENGQSGGENDTCFSLPEGEVVEQKLIKENLTWEEIAAELGCSLKDAKRQYAKHAFRRPWQLDWLLHYLYVEKNMTAKRIARELECDRGTVTKWLKKHGIETRWPLSGEEHPLWEGGSERYYGPNWQSQRRKARERDTPEDKEEPVCQRCGMEDSKHLDEFNKRLAVHHITPIREFTDETGELDHEAANRLENLITVCARCHRLWEKCQPLEIQPSFSD